MMNKNAFLNELRKRLSGLPQDDVEEWISFHSEMIADRIEDGLTEEEAVSEAGTVDEVAAQILSDIPLTKLVKNKVAPKRTRRIGGTVLLILSSPLWLGLLIAVFAVILAVYAVLWVLVICAYAVCFSMAAGAVWGIPGAFLSLRSGSVAGALFYIGAGLLCAGLAILLRFACVWAAKRVLALTRKIIPGIKRAFIRQSDK